MTDSSYLTKYATTPRQIELLEAIAEHGSVSAASKVIGMESTNAYRTIRSLKSKAAISGDAPEADMVHKVPEPFVVGGVSTLYNKEGEPKLQWVKSKLSPAMHEHIMGEAAKAWAADLPKYEPQKGPESPKSDLMNMFILTDYHLGMLAWPPETGEAWDIKIAEGLAMKYINAAVDMTPDADQALLVIMGDFLHYDGLESVTPQSKHPLDSDARFPKLVILAIKIIRAMVDRLLATHSSVRVIVSHGNHDQASSVWMRTAVDLVYEKETRLSVDMSPDVYNAYQFGNVGIYTHHGDKRKITNVDTVFAKKFRDIWGCTKHSYAHLGHLHNQKSMETNLMLITQHRTLAANDAYAARGGWLAEREATVVTYHKEYGRVSEIFLTPDMLQADQS